MLVFAMVGKFRGIQALLVKAGKLTLGELVRLNKEEVMQYKILR